MQWGTASQYFARMHGNSLMSHDHLCPEGICRVCVCEREIVL